jgi:hypothetical protein
MMCISVPTRSWADIGATIAPAASMIRRAMFEISPRLDRRPTEYFSCFISYSWADQDFALRLHDDLQDVGVRSWLDAKEIKVGASFSLAIDKAIQAHDKLIAVLSRDSINSASVKKEITKAIELERERNQTVLFPIRIDDAIFDISDTNETYELRGRYIIDFRHWRDKSLYQRAFSQLVRDLAINASVESGRRS